MWHDDQVSGHQDDIMCIAHCPPNILATGDYSGEIILWSVVSGNAHARLHASRFTGRSGTQMLSQEFFLR